MAAPIAGTGNFAGMTLDPTTGLWKGQSTAVPWQNISKVGNSYVTKIGADRFFVPTSFAAGGGGHASLSPEAAKKYGGTAYEIPGKGEGGAPLQGYSFSAADIAKWAPGRDPVEALGNTFNAQNPAVMAYRPGAGGKAATMEGMTQLAPLAAAAGAAAFAPAAAAGSGTAAAGGGVTGAGGIGLESGLPASIQLGQTAEGTAGLMNVGAGGASGAGSAGIGAGAAPAAGTTGGLFGGGGALGTGLSGNALANLAATGVGVIGGGLALANGNKKSESVDRTVPPPSAAEQSLINLNTQLSKAQVGNVNAMSPYQAELYKAATDAIKQQTAQSAAENAAISPEQRAALAKQQYDSAIAQGPMQQRLLQMQMDSLEQGGRATPQQLQDIGHATDTAIAAGTGDINTQTRRGIGMIADELANSRGLRLSDAPIGSEAALLTRAGNDQIASLTNNLRAGQASATLNYPLAVQGLQGNINQGQQGLMSNVANFQQQLQQQAYQNRLALTGQTAQSGIGLANIGNNGALSALNSARIAGTDYTQNSNAGINLGQVGQFMSGIGGLQSYFK